MRRTAAPLRSWAIVRPTHDPTLVEWGADCELSSDRIFLITQAQYEGGTDGDQDLDPLAHAVVFGHVSWDEVTAAGFPRRRAARA